jgi:hypothetical protein
MKLRLGKRISAPRYYYMATDENGQLHQVCFFDERPFGKDLRELQGAEIDCELVPFTETATKAKLLRDDEP